MIGKMKRILASALALALLTGLLTACGGGGALTVTVKNALAHGVAELYISETTAETWGDTILTGELADGDALEVALKPAGEPNYDIMAIDTDGDYYYFYGLPLSNKATVSLASNDAGWEAVVTPEKGDAVVVPGNQEFREASAEGKVLSAPSAADPLDSSAAMPGYESLVVPYPSTMKVVKSQDLQLQIDAVNEPDLYEDIIVSLIKLGGSYETRLNAGESSAKIALADITTKVHEMLFPNKFVSSIGSDFVNAGNYYSCAYYVWMSGAVFEEAAETPVRGVLECRYYGPTGYVLVIFTLADESAIKRYYDIATNIANQISFNPGWSTAQVVNSNTSNPGSDPGDYGLYYEDEWYEPNDYDPWSDPGDYGYYDDYDSWSDPGDYGYYNDGETDWYYDDGWYESNDYDPWSDPGDYGYDY